jgi:hypothetical protein
VAADIDSQILRASRIEEAIDLFRAGKRADRVRTILRNKYDLGQRVVEEYVKAAIRQLGPEFARSLNVLRYMDENEIRGAALLALSTASKAAKAGDFVGCAMNLRSYAAIKQLHHRLWHLDKHSPFLGLEEREKRTMLVEAVRDGAHLIPAEQRQELLDALSEVEGDDESLTTTLEAAQ